MWWELEDTLFSLFIGVVCGLIMTILFVLLTANLTWIAFLFMLAIGIAIGFALVAYIEYGWTGEVFVALWAWVKREGKPLWIKTKASYNWMMRDPDPTDDIPAKKKTKKKVTKKKAKKKVTKKKTKKIKRK